MFGSNRDIKIEAQQARECPLKERRRPAADATDRLLFARCFLEVRCQARQTGCAESTEFRRNLSPLAN
jgi:hypothetical protein